MNNILKRITVLVLTALMIFTILPTTSVLAADSAPAHTSITTTGKGDTLKITYKLNLDKTAVTDGRVAITYDSDILVLTKDTEGISFAEKDVNKNYANNDETGISYAFVNDSSKNVNGTIISLKFEVKKGVEYQDTIIKTTIFGINNEDTEVITDTVLEDTVSVGVGALVKPSLTKLDQTLIGVNVKWDKDNNADGYIIYRSTSENGNYTQVGTSKGTSFWDIRVANNKTYYYKIKSYQGNGKNRVYSEESNVLSSKVKKFKLF